MSEQNEKSGGPYRYFKAENCGEWRFPAGSNHGEWRSSPRHDWQRSMSDLDELWKDPAFIETDEHGTALALAGVKRSRLLDVARQPGIPLEQWQDQAAAERERARRAGQAPPADAPAKDTGETPRTDAESAKEYLGHDVMTDTHEYGEEVVSAEFARTLEREAAALRDENDRLIELVREADFVKDQRDAYLSDLEEIGKIIGCGHIAEGLARCVRERIEEAALADGKGEKPCGGD